MANQSQNDEDKAKPNLPLGGVSLKMVKSSPTRATTHKATPRPKPIHPAATTPPLCHLKGKAIAHAPP